MPKYIVDIGTHYGAYTWDTDDMDETHYTTSGFPADTDIDYDDTLGTFYGFRTTARIAGLGFDITGGETDDPLVFNNNTPIKWKTTAGNKRHMLKLNSNDYFVIGSNDADGSDEIRFDISGINDVVRMTSAGVNLADANAYLGSQSDPDLLFLGSGVLTIAGDLVGDSSFNIGPLGDTDLLVLASGLLTINGDLVGDSSFNIGPTGDADLLVLASALATVNGNITLEKASTTTILTVGDGTTAQTKRIALDSPNNAASQSQLQFQQAGTAKWTIYRVGNVDSLNIYSHTNSQNEVTFETTGVTIRLDLAINGGDLTSSSSSFNFLTSNVTTFTALQAMTSGSWGATTGSTRFRHDIYIGDGSGAQFLEISGGAANRDLIWSNNGSGRWRTRVDSSEDFYLYRSADGSTFYQVMYIPNSSGYGYLGTDPRWAWDTQGRLKNRTLDHDVTCYFFDDFHYTGYPSASGTASWALWAVTIGSGAITASANPNGCARMVTSGSGELNFYHAFNKNFDTSKVPLILEFRAINNVTATNGKLHLGLFDTLGTNAYIRFYKDETNSGNWQCLSYDGTHSVNTTTTSSSSTSWRLLRIEVTASNELKFYIDDTLVATHTSNFRFDTHELYISASYNASNATDASMDVDYCKITTARA